jgi:2,4'-dihydroxyacetophenone dioxygenase
MTTAPQAPALPAVSDVAHTDDFPWAQWADGLWVKVLRASPDTGQYAMLTKFERGVELPIHRHFGAVHAFTLQGAWRYKEYDWVARAGTFAYEPPGSTHTLVVDQVDEDTIVLFTIEGGLIVFGPDGEYWVYEDAETSRERYVQALEAQGLPVPALLT